MLTAMLEPAACARARPLLGTIVSIRISDCGSADIRAAMDAAFAEIALVHRLMSFQEERSDLGRANRDAPGALVAVHPLTRACVTTALDHARASDGAFDPVARGGTWRDVELCNEGLRYARPLAIDLSGIAKGFAVDRACAVLAEQGVASAIVNAGGDLRAFGPIEETVALRPSHATDPAMVLLREGAIASSDTILAREQSGSARHRDGRDGATVVDRFVSVAAPRCVDADALTKVVLALGEQAARVLARYRATGWISDAAGWRAVGLAAAA